ncbi:hypothetical protein PAHAL_1G378200 [Panicum hallii]|uniref:Transcription factor CBF/NF-Y/archaeal histone domain-containing protein n=1 Tax=Panicum hallii TaxID=206008 RepID=A0A2T8KXK0_9POAL|nr:nuclear transcription factor Y subunit B-1-like [Panicum hallii]PVH66894.1 hypothetical protein PAHAL_1G378200 [Panicum hallii]
MAMALPTKFHKIERMGRKAKRGGAKKGVRDAEKTKVAPADCASPDGEGGSASAAAGLPMANLVRLMRQVIPKGVKVSTRAKHLTHDCAVEFVGFVAGEASEQARAQHRRIISPEDFTRAFQTLGLDDYVEPMSTYIRRYREHHNIAAGYGGFVTRAPPVAATAAAAPVTAPGVPCFSDEEMQHLSSMVLPPAHGEHDGEGSSSAYTPTPAGRCYSYTGYM